MRRSSHSRQRVDHRDADAVQAARDLVGVLLEFSAGMQLGHDDFGGRNAFVGVDVGGHAAAVVAHGAGAVGVQDHVDAVGEAAQRLVDGVVDDLVDHVMQARAVIGVADIHARPLAHGIEALQHLDAVGAVIVRVLLLMLRVVLQLFVLPLRSCHQLTATPTPAPTMMTAAALVDAPRALPAGQECPHMGRAAPHRPA